MGHKRCPARARRANVPPLCSLYGSLGHKHDVSVSHRCTPFVKEGAFAWRAFFLHPDFSPSFTLR